MLIFPYYGKPRRICCRLILSDTVLDSYCMHWRAEKGWRKGYIQLQVIAYLFPQTLERHGFCQVFFRKLMLCLNWLFECCSEMVCSNTWIGTFLKWNVFSLDLVEIHLAFIPNKWLFLLKNVLVVLKRLLTFDSAFDGI